MKRDGCNNFNTNIIHKTFIQETVGDGFISENNLKYTGVVVPCYDEFEGIIGLYTEKRHMHVDSVAP